MTDYPVIHCSESVPVYLNRTVRWQAKFRIQFVVPQCPESRTIDGATCEEAAREAVHLLLPKR